MQSHILDISAFESEHVFKALASETRLRILKLLAERDHNINELGSALEVNIPTISKHVQILELAGLVASEYMAGVQGTQKRCSLRYDRLIVSLESELVSQDQIEEIEMPIGLYSLVHPSPTCGLVNRERPIGLADEPQAFFLPERASAELIWMAEGFVEYVFPNTLPTSVEIHRVELAMEICAEAPDFNNDFPSDITVWVNNVEVGTWVCPGDFGGKRGRLNPAWWSDHATQYGSLKVWSVTPEGSYVDGLVVSETGIADIMVMPQQAVTVRIGVKPDATHRGGFNLFGQGFGNHAQGLTLRLHYKPREQFRVTNGAARSLATKEN